VFPVRYELDFVNIIEMSAVTQTQLIRHVSGSNVTGSCDPIPVEDKEFVYSP
jgi:hypothetical protein